MAEEHKERIDRELIELLNELRVALPGVQVLFAFLLIVPFQQGFDRVSDVSRGVYLAALLLSAASIGLIITPSSYHRLHFRRGEKERLLRTSNKLVIWGTALMAAATACSIYVIVDLVFGSTLGAIVAAVAAAWYAWFWYGLPLSRRGPESDEDGEAEQRQAEGGSSAA